MHGVKRSRLTAEAKAQRKAKEASKLQAYLGLEEEFFAAVSRAGFFRRNLLVAELVFDAIRNARIS